MGISARKNKGRTYPKQSFTRPGVHFIPISWLWQHHHPKFLVIVWFFVAFFFKSPDAFVVGKWDWKESKVIWHDLIARPLLRCQFELTFTNCLPIRFLKFTGLNPSMCLDWIDFQRMFQEVVKKRAKPPMQPLGTFDLKSVDDSSPIISLIKSWKYDQQQRMKSFKRYIETS
jgi:hypothetical protein